MVLTENKQEASAEGTARGVRQELTDGKDQHTRRVVRTQKPAHGQAAQHPQAGTVFCWRFLVFFFHKFVFLCRGKNDMKFLSFFCKTFSTPKSCFGVFELHLDKKTPENSIKNSSGGGGEEEVGGCFLDGLCRCTWAFGFFLSVLERQLKGCYSWEGAHMRWHVHSRRKGHLKTKNKKGKSVGCFLPVFFWFGFFLGPSGMACILYYCVFIRKRRRVCGEGGEGMT
jgi:hypothetical protein